jgi:hypothetical protein
MYWGRVVAAIYCILIIVTMFFQLSGINLNLQISVGSKTNPPDRLITPTPDPSLQTPMSDFPGTAVTASMILIATQAFVPALMCFNKVADAPKGEDGLIEARVLILFKVVLGLQSVFWVLKMAANAYFVSGTQTSIPYIIQAVTCGLSAAFSFVLMFAFTRHPLEAPITRTNKVTWFALSGSVVSLAGILAGAILELILPNISFDGSMNAFTNIWFFMLLVGVVSSTLLAFYVFDQPVFPLKPPLWLKFRNDHGGMSKSHFNLYAFFIFCLFGFHLWLARAILFHVAMFVALALLLGAGYAVTVTADGDGIAIGYLVGFHCTAIVLVLTLIQLNRQRKAFVAGYPAVYAEVHDEKYAQPPSNPA